MTMRALSFIALLLVFSGSAAAQTPKPDHAALSTELQRGGHVIVFRHGATHGNQADLAPLKAGADQLTVSLWLGQDRRAIADWPLAQPNREVA